MSTTSSIQILNPSGTELAPVTPFGLSLLNALTAEAGRTLLEIGDISVGAEITGGTAGRVFFESSGNLLAQDADFSFSVDTLTVTKVTTTLITMSAADFTTATISSSGNPNGYIGIFPNGAGTLLVGTTKILLTGELVIGFPFDLGLVRDGVSSGRISDGGAGVGKLTFLLPAAATTGLVAGALAATTNASIVLTDAAGQAYRVPCII